MPLARGTVHEAAVRRLRAAAAETIVRRARAVLGSVVHPTRVTTTPWTEIPPDALRVELAVEETIEHAPLQASAASAQRAAGERSPSGSRGVLLDDVWAEVETRRRQSVVLCLDTSLSMQGEKLALMGVAVAVVRLQFPDDPVGVIGFDDRGRVLAHPDEPLSARALVERLLDVPGRPYTNLEAGLRRALAMTGERRGRPPSTVLVTDGKYTAGADPAFLAKHFAHLTVLKVGADRAGLPLCRELASRGNGALREAPRLDALPFAMYGAVQEILRGRA